MPKTVLLADDSVTAQNMGRRILTDAGYEVITVNNGSAALKKIHESRPDLIVLDVYMPGYGGLEVCQRLKEAGETMRIPVLLTVGKMEPFKTDEARRVRADGHIIKPFEASELLAALTKLEDRIVPEAETSRSGKSKKEKKSRFWNLERSEPVKEDDPSGEISRLAELKRRERDQPAPQPEPEAAQEIAPAKPRIDETTSEKVVEEMPVAKADEFFAPTPDDSAPATFASANIPEVPAGAAETKPASADEFAVATPQYEEPTPEAPAAAVEEPAPTAEPAAESVAPPVEPVSAPAKPRWVAENVALSAEEASLALDQEMQQAQSNVAPPAIDRAEDVAVITQEVPTTQLTPEVEKSGAAFAAAAASSSDAVSAAYANPAPSEPEAEPPVASEAAAAWKNWEQIRDRVIGTQQSEAIAESLAEAARMSLPAISNSPAINESQAADSATAKTESASVPQLEGEALASIVDTVLAELKPKLMAEIAKKLSTEKK